MTTRQERAAAHARHAYFCKCGVVVHGNGARAMHFYVDGDRALGFRDGHLKLPRAEFFKRFPDWKPDDS